MRRRGARGEGARAGAFRRHATSRPLRDAAHEARLGRFLIETLRVRNLVTIESLELELGPGLTVVTGETGAGKSVLLGAIALLSGQRVGAELLRAGAADASVEALLRSPALLARARELGLAGEDDEELLVTRTLAREGRGKVFVNGKLATVALLAELVGEALEITSQGEHQRLLRPEAQAGLLDAYAELGGAAGEVADLYRRWRELAGAIAARRRDREAIARREDQLRYEIDQIDRAAPTAGELEEIGAEHSRLAHVDRLAQASALALECLDGDDGLREKLGTARAVLRGLAELDAELAEPEAALERARLELDEASHSLSRYATRLEADPERLARVEQRIAELRRLLTRYGATLEDVLAHRDRAREELGGLAGGDERTAELERELLAVAEQLDGRSRALSDARRAAARRLERAVASELSELELGRAKLQVAFEPLAAKGADGLDPPSGPSGRERAVFLLAANPGEAPGRLRDAASGGELSRLLLALRNVLRDADSGGLLLFDEIDAGLGGRTAVRVGERLRALAGRNQVICITHLPQLAALGDAHHRVVKSVRAGRTTTRIELLEGESRVDELARMGGGRVTDAARAHARELLSVGGPDCARRV
ncbi:MAG: DNA repair protein RecN [Deltaproteobacteria bacterium]|nr:DNA repair protein RecN [Deltaproteobacteria bacterium]